MKGNGWSHTLFLCFKALNGRFLHPLSLSCGSLRFVSSSFKVLKQTCRARFTHHFFISVSPAWLAWALGFWEFVQLFQFYLRVGTITFLGAMQIISRPVHFYGSSWVAVSEVLSRPRCRLVGSDVSFLCAFALLHAFFLPTTPFPYSHCNLIEFNFYKSLTGMMNPDSFFKCMCNQW